MKKICVATSNRADFGLLRWLMEDLKVCNAFELQVLATGGHFSEQQGYTWRQIEEAGFEINSKIDELESGDIGADAGVEMGRILGASAIELAQLNSDLLIVLGDRYEILAVVSAAVLQNITVAHIHGGEVTEGAFDDSIRHAITKLSDIHFTAADEYRKRVIQMGENPDRVYNVGAIGLDAIDRLKLLSEEELRNDLSIDRRMPYFLVTWHPETMSIASTVDNFQEVLRALESVEEHMCLFTRANNDPMGQAINDELNKYLSRNKTWRVFDTLGSKKYLSAMKFAKAVVGNSSSGIIEAPAMGVPTINIGDRQKGRLRAASIIDVKPNGPEILTAINAAKVKFRKNRKIPYGISGASLKILSFIKILLT
ncbi:MAG: UDP-N-acetylglucosamine 2-epimerase (hydrolyzing) [Proteobacteria bacterium]|nr:UDP-N-acetylglucosamine 2-epimerase (hydrolyzing) [Pseudomonadota bacterium]